jgi:hypothetical protein
MNFHYLLINIKIKNMTEREEIVELREKVSQFVMHLFLNFLENGSLKYILK